VDGGRGTGDEARETGRELRARHLLHLNLNGEKLPDSVRSRRLFAWPPHSTILPYGSVAMRSGKVAGRASTSRGNKGDVKHHASSPGKTDIMRYLV
jgi:hypothetical protein